MKPIIGITPSYSYDELKFSLRQDYVSAIQNAGGEPVLLFPGTEFPSFVQGILLSGGGDIDPLLFNEEPLDKNGEISPLRDEFELNLCREALQKKLPLLGICRGMQVLCTVTHGKILQDIQSQTSGRLKHMQSAPRFHPTHTVQITEVSFLAKITGKKSFPVNSFHHQAISSPGEGFAVCAYSSDGLIEAIEYTKDSFALGVQWHPELIKTDEQQAIFSAFVTACKQKALSH